MFGLKIFVRVQTFRWVPPVLPCNFCHPKLGIMSDFHEHRALTHMTNQSSHESSNQLKIVGEVASGTVAAVSTMYMALENSSKILAKNIANNTVIPHH